MIERVRDMAQRKKCRLANSAYKAVDLRQYQDLIITTIEEILPGKHPHVYQDYFSTDPLTQDEAILLGRELSKLPELAQYGKEVTSFRLFDGRTYDSEDALAPSKKKKIIKKPEGGRMQ